MACDFGALHFSERDGSSVGVTIPEFDEPFWQLDDLDRLMPLPLEMLLIYQIIQLSLSLSPSLPTALKICDPPSAHPPSFYLSLSLSNLPPSAAAAVASASYHTLYEPHPRSHTLCEPLLPKSSSFYEPPPEFSSLCKPPLPPPTTHQPPSPCFSFLFFFFSFVS